MPVESSILPVAVLCVNVVITGLIAASIGVNWRRGPWFLRFFCIRLLAVLALIGLTITLDVVLNMTTTIRPMTYVYGFGLVFVNFIAVAWAYQRDVIKYSKDS